MMFRFYPERRSVVHLPLSFRLESAVLSPNWGIYKKAPAAFLFCQEQEDGRCILSPGIMVIPSEARHLF